MCKALPTAEEMPNTNAKIDCGAGTSGHQRAAENRVAAAVAKKRESKLETRMLKLCLGITCLFAVTYTALSTRIVLDIFQLSPRSLTRVSRRAKRASVVRNILIRAKVNLEPRTLPIKVNTIAHDATRSSV